MTRRSPHDVRRFAVLTVIILALDAHTATAQFVVYDPTNYAQALARYAQIVQQYQLLIRQARRLPARVPRATGYRSRGGARTISAPLTPTRARSSRR